MGHTSLNDIKDRSTRQIWGIWKLRPAYSPETPNLGQNRWCFVPCDLKFDGWPWKTIGHLSFAVSSFVQHFIAIGQFKLELQSGNAHFGSNSTIFRAVWPWNLTNDLEKTIGHLYYATSSSMHHLLAIGEFKLELQSGNAQFGSKSTIFFFSHVTLQFDVWPWKTIGHLFYATSSFVHHFVAICDLKLELQSGNAQFGSNSMIFRAVWPCNLTYDLEKQ